MPSIARFDQWQNSAGLNYGTVLQVVSTTDGSYNAISVSSGSTTNWTSATITRRVANSKILVMFSGNLGQSSNTDSGIRMSSSMDGRITAAEGSAGNSMKSITSLGTDRGGTGPLAGTSSYFMEKCDFNYLYTPSVNNTSAITITIQIYTDGSMTLYPNGEGWRGGGEQAKTTAAHLILMEISS
jgi:hypothetical protein